MNLGLLRTVNVSDIELDLNARARESYGILANLARNIEEHGLIHPIVIYSPNGEAPYKLVAGARRFAACSQILKVEEISCRIYDTPMTEQELKAIELYENVMRLNLTAMEEAKLRTQLHETMQEIHGVKTTSSSGHSVEDTAKMLGVSKRTVTNALRLARAERAHPELKLDEEKTASAALLKLETEEKRKAPKRETRRVEPKPEEQSASPKFVPTSPQTLTRDQWTEMVKTGASQEWNRDKFVSIAQQLVVRESQDGTREELRELVKLLNVTIGA